MLQHVIHSLMLLPDGVVWQLLHQLITLLPQLDVLSRLIPNVAYLERIEFEGTPDSSTSSIGRWRCCDLLAWLVQ